MTLEPLESVLLVFQEKARPLPDRFATDESAHGSAACPWFATRQPGRPATLCPVSRRCGRTSGDGLTLSPVKADPFEGQAQVPGEFDLARSRAVLELDNLSPEAAARDCQRSVRGRIHRPAVPARCDPPAPDRAEHHPDRTVCARNRPARDQRPAPFRREVIMNRIHWLLICVLAVCSIPPHPSPGGRTGESRHERPGPGYLEQAGIVAQTHREAADFRAIRRLRQRRIAEGLRGGVSENRPLARADRPGLRRVPHRWARLQGRQPPGHRLRPQGRPGNDQCPSLQSGQPTRRRPARQGRGAGERCSPLATRHMVRWMHELDILAAGLGELQDAGVVVLWRPFHEVNGDWFWWGGKKPETFIRVWRHMFDYFTKTKKLNNLLWVYGPEPRQAHRRLLCRRCLCGYRRARRVYRLCRSPAHSRLSRKLRGCPSRSALPNSARTARTILRAIMTTGDSATGSRPISPAPRSSSAGTASGAWAGTMQTKTLLDHPWIINREDLPREIRPAIDNSIQFRPVDWMESVDYDHLHDRHFTGSSLDEIEAQHPTRLGGGIRTDDLSTQAVWPGRQFSLTQGHEPDDVLAHCTDRRVRPGVDRPGKSGRRRNHMPACCA